MFGASPNLRLGLMSGCRKTLPQGEVLCGDLVWEGRRKAKGQTHVGPDREGRVPGLARGRFLGGFEYGWRNLWLVKANLLEPGPALHQPLVWAACGPQHEEVEGAAFPVETGSTILRPCLDPSHTREIWCMLGSSTTCWGYLLVTPCPNWKSRQTCCLESLGRNSSHHTGLSHSCMNLYEFVWKCGIFIILYFKFQWLIIIFANVFHELMAIKIGTEPHAPWSKTQFISCRGGWSPTHS